MSCQSWYRNMRGKYITAGEIARVLQGSIWGNPDARLYGIALPQESDSKMLTFYSGRDSREYLPRISFGACIVPLSGVCNDNRTYIVTMRQPDDILHTVLRYMCGRGMYQYSYTEDNHIAENVQFGQNVSLGKGVAIGKNTIIENNVVIGSGVSVGEGSLIRSHVTICDRVRVGDRVIIQCGAVVGGDSFEFDFNDTDGYQKIVNVGSVDIQDDVEIGSNTTIDRGTIGDTVIGSGTKIDNLVHIAHEVKIGRRCKICAQCGIAGWSVVGDGTVLYGQVGVADQVEIDHEVTVLGKSGVTKHITAGQVVSGIPARDNRERLRELSFLKKQNRKRREKYGDK